MAAALVVLGARGAAARCGDQSADAQGLAEAHTQVEAECSCASAANHHRYVACAVGVARRRVASGLLSKSCTRSVKRCAAKSVCGKRGAVTCCLTRKGSTRCKIKKKAATCLAKGGCVGLFSSCCDACTATGCRARPTTTTTITATTSTSTALTSPITITTTSSTTTTTFGEGQICQQFTAPDGPSEPLPCGGTTACLLDPPGDQDAFTFTVPDGAAVSIDVSGTHIPCWQLFGPSGQLNQPQCDAISNEAGLAAGTYTIVVNEVTNQMTDYVLSLQGVSESFHCGTMLNVPSDTRMDSLSPAGDTDSFNFMGQTSQSATITIAGDQNPCWEVFAPDGTRLITQRCRTDGAVVVPLPATGTYTIVVHELLNQTSNYTLSLQLVTP